MTLSSEVCFMPTYFRSFESAPEATERGEWTEFSGKIGETLMCDRFGLIEVPQHAKDHGYVVSKADVAGQAFILIRCDISKADLS